MLCLLENSVIRLSFIGIDARFDARSAVIEDENSKGMNQIERPAFGGKNELRYELRHR
jgi:hypothetical protein